MKTLLAFLTLVVLLGVSAATAGNSKLAVSPSAPHVGDSLVFSGCGYAPGIYLIVQAVLNGNPPPNIWFQTGPLTDASGCFTTADDPYVVANAGKWTATVWYGNNRKEATLNFTVAP